MCKIISFKNFKENGVITEEKEDKRFLKLRKSYKDYLEKHNWSDTLYAYQLYLQSEKYVREFLM